LFLFLVPFFPYFLLFLWFLESGYFFWQVFRKSLLTPVFTKKIFVLFLSLFSFYLSIVFFFWQKANFPLILLFLDLLLPIFVSFFVLFFQIPVIFWKYHLIKKATKKIENFPSLFSIGIVGSFGKTSTKEFLSTILNEKFSVLKTKENQNNEISISKLILNDLKKEHQIFVCEMGAYKKGEIKILTQMVKPKMAILTGVNFQHLALFGSMENLISAEGGKEIVDFIDKDGLVIINGENEILRETFSSIKERKILVKEKGFDSIKIEDLKVGKDYISFRISSLNFSSFLELPLVGRENIQNLLLAICAAQNLGMNLPQIISGLKKIDKESQRVKIKRGKNGVDILESTYSTNPDGILSHIEHLKLWQGKKIIVFVPLIELGKKAKEIHLEIGKKIGKICDLGIVVDRDYLKELQETSKGKVLFLEKENEILNKLQPFFEKDNVILLEGRLPKRILKIFY
jgi:UDP-N-acetylmuramoyl-tripeptide--D-alanyl-D-alanine ligase